jgi:hypothetical protein
MKIITTRELRNQTKAVFEMADKERVAVKRGKKYVNLTVSDDPAKPLLDEEWVRGFFAIPEEFRVNPFEVSPSGDLFWADRRNVEDLKQATEQLHTDLANGVKLTSWEEFRKTLDL